MTDMEPASKLPSPVHVTLASLVAMHKAARSLPAIPQAIKASGGDSYLSAFRGRGMEYDESRPYQIGDDVRSLDWRVMARTGKPHTKVFREERERPVFCLVDYRSRMFFGTRGVFKHVLAAELASLAAWRAVINGDRVGGLVFSDREHHELKPQRGRASTLHLLRQLEQAQDWIRSDQQRPSAINSALARLRRMARPGSLLMLFSDFQGLDTTGRAHISNMARHNTLLMFYVHDPIEAELPPPGRYPMVSGQQSWVVDSADAGTVRDHQQRYLDHQRGLQEICRRNGCSFIACSTAEAPQGLMLRALGGREAS
jgi:uncharacterized protein (DUF58 family)